MRSWTKSQPHPWGNPWGNQWGNCSNGRDAFSGYLESPWPLKNGAITQNNGVIDPLKLERGPLISQVVFSLFLKSVFLFFLGFGQNAAKLSVCKNPPLTGSLSGTFSRVMETGHFVVFSFFSFGEVDGIAQLCQHRGDRRASQWSRTWWSPNETVARWS